MNGADTAGASAQPPVLGLVMPWPREDDPPPVPAVAAAPRRELTKGQGRALRVAVGVVIAGMAMGFASSFVTLTHAARLHQWSVPALLPLSVDSGILAYVLLDHLAVSLGSRSRCLHWAAWSLAAFTVWANAAVSPADGATWRVIHAAMPALWVLGVEALRFMWRKLHEDPAAVSDRIPAGRWFASPWPAFRLWRRMRLLNVTSYPYAVALAESAMLARDLVSADPGWDAAPVLLRDRIRSWRFPAPVHNAIRVALEDGLMPDTAQAVQDMVTEELTRYDRHRGVLQGRRADIARDARRAALEASAVPAPQASLAPPAVPVPDMPEPAPEATPEARPAARTKQACKPALKLSAGKSRGMSPERLSVHARAMLDEYGMVSVNRIKQDLHVGTDKAQKAHRIVCPEAYRDGTDGGGEVVQMARRA